MDKISYGSYVLRICAYIGVVVASLMWFLFSALIAFRLTGSAAWTNVWAGVFSVVPFIVFSTLGWLSVRHGWGSWFFRPRGSHPFFSPQAFHQAVEDRPSVWWYVRVVIACAAVFVTAQVVGRSYIATFGSPSFAEMSRAQAGYDLVPVLIAITVSSPIGEEFLHRGVVFTMFRGLLPPLGAAVVSALVFSAVHMNMAQAVTTVFLGFVSALLYERTHMMVYPIAFHMLFNIGSMFFRITAPDSVVLFILFVVCALCTCVWAWVAIFYGAKRRSTPSFIALNGAVFPCHKQRDMRHLQSWRRGNG